MKESSSIVVMDKYIEQSTIDFLTDFVRNKMPQNDWNVEIHINGYKQHIGHTITLYDNVKQS